MVESSNRSQGAKTLKNSHSTNNLLISKLIFIYYCHCNYSNDIYLIATNKIIYASHLMCDIIAIGDNMQKIAKFEKVSFDQYKKDYFETFGNLDNIEEIYNAISLPQRATKGSAGYDFYAPINITLKPNETIKIPTGIRVKIEDGWVLKCYPRSGLGFKYRMQLNNTVGIIDSDYYYSSNEGHIFTKITNDTNEGKTIEIKVNQGFMQGIFVEFGITIDDNAIEIRNGGFGSTTK